MSGRYYLAVPLSLSVVFSKSFAWESSIATLPSSDCGATWFAQTVATWARPEDACAAMEHALAVANLTFRADTAIAQTVFVVGRCGVVCSVADWRVMRTLRVDGDLSSGRGLSDG